MQQTTTLQNAILEAQAGQFEQFALYFKKNERTFLAQANKIVADMEVSRDIVADAYIKAQRKINSYNFTCHINTWLITIVRNLSLDYMRKLKKSREVIDASASVETCNIPSQEGMSFDIKQMLADAVNELSEIQQKLVELKFFQEFSLEDIATETSLPIGTVKGYLHKITKQILYKKLCRMGVQY